MWTRHTANNKLGALLDQVPRSSVVANGVAAGLSRPGAKAVARPQRYPHRAPRRVCPRAVQDGAHAPANRAQAGAGRRRAAAGRLTAVQGRASGLQLLNRVLRDLAFGTVGLIPDAPHHDRREGRPLEGGGPRHCSRRNQHGWLTAASQSVEAVRDHDAISRLHGRATIVRPGFRVIPVITACRCTSRVRARQVRSAVRLTVAFPKVRPRVLFLLWTASSRRGPGSRDRAAGIRRWAPPEW